MWLVFDLLYSAILNHILFLFHKILHVTLFLRQTILHYIAASYSTYSIHIISFMIYSTILHYYISKYHVTLSVTLHYITLRYTCYIHVIFLYTFSRMPNRWHTHTRHFTTRIFGNVRRDSLVDLWHTVLEKCVARIPLRPACHCCP